jgi:hypothetical protein
LQNHKERLVKRPHITFSILMIVSLLTGCAFSANAREVGMPEEVSPPVRLAEESNPSILLPKHETTSKDIPTNCPVTVSPIPAFVPPPPYSSLGFEGEFWFGAEDLWTALPADGVWAGLPNNPQGYTQKIFWWRDGYVWNEEPEPQLTVSGEKLDSKAPPLLVSKATNAYAEDIGSAMLVGVDFPTPGCWRITGQYGKAELSFVVWVEP